MFGNPETTPGGRALKFYSSVRLDIRRIGAVKDSTGRVRQPYKSEGREEQGRAAFHGSRVRYPVREGDHLGGVSPRFGHQAQPHHEAGLLALLRG